MAGDLPVIIVVPPMPRRDLIERAWVDGIPGPVPHISAWDAIKIVPREDFPPSYTEFINSTFTYPHQRAFLESLLKEVTMFTSTGHEDIRAKLKHYHFQVVELLPEDTVSGHPGFTATKDGVTVRFDGTLYVDNELVDTPFGPFDVSIQEHVEWFFNNFTLFTKPDPLAPDHQPDPFSQPLEPDA